MIGVSKAESQECIIDAAAFHSLMHFVAFVRSHGRTKDAFCHRASPPPSDAAINRPLRLAASITAAMTTSSSLSTPLSSQRRRPLLHTRKEVRTILNWPTETVSIDYCIVGGAHNEEQVPIPSHTVLLFIPGNPGCIEWYIPLLKDLIESLGTGFAARGVSYAGHGASDAVANVQQHYNVTDKKKNDRDTRIPWSVNGQVQHKIAWIDMILKELNGKDAPILSRTKPRFIFLTHSIGAHLVQRLLVLRPDILMRTSLILHLMPFMRMDAPQPQQTILSCVSQHPKPVIFMAQTLSSICKMLPDSYLEYVMRHSVKDKDGRRIAIYLLKQPHMARNFFELGCQEIRDLPQDLDVSG